MELMHVQGAYFINWLQNFPSLESLMINISHSGSPLLAYAFAFPIAYYINPILGLLTILCASFSEWISGLLKWVLHGHRPYWWVRVYADQTNTPMIPIQQYPITCEVGPGSPSGHCMVTLAAWIPIVLFLQHCLPRYQCWMLNAVFFGFIVLLGLSRCFVAAHFPHQTIAGIASGLLMGHLFYSAFGLARLAKEANPATSLAVTESPISWLVHWLHQPNTMAWLGFLSLGLAWIFSLCLQHVFHMDINWSMVLAQRACHRAEWVHLTTSLMVGFARIAGYLSGFSLALHLFPPSGAELWRINCSFSVIPVAVIGVIATKWSEYFIRESMEAIFKAVFSIAHLTQSGVNPGSLLLFISVFQASVGPLLAVGLLPTMLKYLIT